MPVFHDSALIGAAGASGAGAGGYQISRSLRFNSSDSAYLSRTPASAGNRKTWTWAGWVKRSKLGEYVRLFNNTASGANAAIQFMDTDKLRLFDVGIGLDLQTTQVFRDASAWYHFVIVVDTTQATSSNRAKFYVNGSQITTFSTSTYPSQNTDGAINNNVAHQIGSLGGSSEFYNGCLADVIFVDGQALDPSSFTEVSATTGQLIPKAYTGSYGANGFRLTFSDNSGTTATTLGKDAAGSNNFTPTNFSVSSGAGNDSLVDTPTSYGTDTGAGGEVRGNYCTWNPLSFEGSPTISNGNLDVKASTTAYASTYSTIALPTSKTYWEINIVTPQSSFTNQTLIVGTCATPAAIGAPASAVNIYGYSTSNLTSYSYQVPSGVQTNAGTAPTAGDILQFAYDGATGKLWVGLNNTWFASGNPTAGTNPLYTYSTTISVSAFARLYSTTPAVAANFGQRPFAYTAPSGFKALCDTNLPAPVVAKPNTVMDVKLYTGNGSTQTIGGLGFSPDLVWIKDRTLVNNHMLFDVIRGANNSLSTSLTNAENTTRTDRLTAFNSDGFSLGADAQEGVNKLNSAHVAWAWDAGTTTSSNGSGSITSQVRANASAGFSIVGFSFPSSGPSSFGHGLNVAPSLVIIKSRSNGSQSWIVGHSSIGWTNYLLLNTTGASSANSTVWNNTAPSSTVVTLGSGFTSGNYGADGIAYCFAPVAGYSSFGSYTGNGSADGPFVFCNFRPRWILIKKTDSITVNGNWLLWDTARGSYNVANQLLIPNLANAEDVNASYGIDVVSNGFKLRATGADYNNNSSVYIYAAFAENPFQYARAR